jgi:hypothetical protein
MTRTADQTLLARMGFSDPDKANPEHDLACRFLCEPEVGAKVLGLAAPSAQHARDRERELGRVWFMTRLGAVTFEGGNVEVPILKGEGQYRQYVGFIDTLIHGRCASERKGNDDVWGPSEPERLFCGVEVKIGATPVGDCVRQVKLYRAFSEAPAWVLATRYDLSKADVEHLRSEGIVHVRLGKGFEAFAERVRASEKSDSPEL